MLLRSLPRATPSSSSFRGPTIRSCLRNSTSSLRICTADIQHQQKRAATAHAISNPTLAQIEKRWEGMPPQEQADLWMALRDRMKNDWHELTLQERKAGMWIGGQTTTFRTARTLPISLRHNMEYSLLNSCFHVRNQAYLQELFFSKLIENYRCSILDSIWSPWPQSPPSSR